MTKKLFWGAAALLAVGGSLWLWMSRVPAAVPPATTAGSSPAPPSHVAADAIRYPAGAPQLSMLRAEGLPASAVPLTDSLSARVVLDEDVTARIGVSVSGRIVAIRAEPGDAVKSGQVLAEIDAPDVGTAYADLDKARVDEDRKLLALTRARELLPGEAIAAKDFEALLADHAQARAETVRAEQRLKNLNPLGLKADGQRLKLLSPLAGMVTDRTATPALEVSAGMAAPLFTVSDTRHLWVLIDLPENLAGQVRRGSAVEISSDAFPDERFMAHVAQGAQLVDPNTRRVALRARLDNPQQKLLPEMFVRARVLQDSGSGVRVPNSAIVNQGIYRYVFVQTAPGEFKRRAVKLLTQGADSSYVGEGLKGDEQVVTAGALLLDAELSARADDKP